MKVFILDDEESIRDTFRWHLEDLGHEVITAAEPRECRAYQGQRCDCAQPCADAILVDYNLPNMNGLDFIELQVRQGCKGAVEHKLLMSGNITQIDLARARRLGCQVVQKPLDFAELDAWLGAIDLDRQVALSTVVNDDQDGHVPSVGP